MLAPSLTPLPERQYGQISSKWQPFPHSCGDGTLAAEY